MSDLADLIRIHSERLHVNVETAMRNLLLFSTIVGIMENDGRLTGKSPLSSARGLYQYVEDSVIPAINRLSKYIGERAWMKPLRVSRDTSTLSREHQTLLFLGDILEKDGSDKYMKPIMETGDRREMLKAYYRLHHTAPDSATISRAERVFYGTYNNYDRGLTV